jgi:hypothetical protein
MRSRSLPWRRPATVEGIPPEPPHRVAKLGEVFGGDNIRGTHLPARYDPQNNPAAPYALTQRFDVDPELLGRFP